MLKGPSGCDPVSRLVLQLYQIWCFYHEMHDFLAMPWLLGVESAIAQFPDQFSTCAKCGMLVYTKKSFLRQSYDECVISILQCASKKNALSTHK